MKRVSYVSVLLATLAMSAGCCAWFCDKPCPEGSVCCAQEQCGSPPFCRLSGSVSGPYTQIDCNPGPTVNVSNGRYNCDTSNGAVTIQGLPGGSVKNCTCNGAGSTCNYP